MDIDRRIARRAEKQLGHITGTEARGFGLSRTQLQYRVRAQGWTKVMPGVFRLPGAPNTFESRLVATKLWLGRRGHFAGQTAAHILGLNGVSQPERIQVAIASGSGCRGLETRRLRPDDRPRLHNVTGFPLPPIERTLLECAATLDHETVGLALDDALRRRMTSVERLKGFLGSAGGKGLRGIKRLRLLVTARDENDERVRTIFETRMLRILKRIEGLEIRPDFHVIAAGRSYYIDFYLPEGALGIECHSKKWHGTERSKYDVVRDRRIGSLGIELLYFSYDDVVFDPDGTETEIRAALARRASVTS